jgi:uridine kinase
LIVEAHHRAAAAVLADRVERLPTPAVGPAIVTIAGESGSGKSETAAALADDLGRRGRMTRILQQDDYFEYPPHTNAIRRREDISRVGPQEVRLDLLNEHLRKIRAGAPTIDAPLVVYQEDRIDRQAIVLSEVDVVIVEGTYTTLLDPVDLRIFIARTYRETNAARVARAREPQTGFLERVLEIEHGIIKAHKDCADVVIGSDYGVAEQAAGT